MNEALLLGAAIWTAGAFALGFWVRGKDVNVLRDKLSEAQRDLAALQEASAFQISEERSISDALSNGDPRERGLLLLGDPSPGEAEGPDGDPEDDVEVVGNA